jgi:hypothetical protein
MTDFDPCYASDSQVRDISNLHLPSVRYVYSDEESTERFKEFHKEISIALNLQLKLHGIKANIKFAFFVSKNPFSVVHLGGDDFVVLLEYRAINYLLILCFRLQSLPPLAELTHSTQIEEDRDFTGKYLLDIAKDFTFNTQKLGNIEETVQTKNVYRAAIHYILGHEIAHIMHGHLEFKRTNDYKAFAPTAEELYLTDKALEMDADSSATTTVFAVFDNVIDRVLREKTYIGKYTETEFVSFMKQQYILGMYIANIFHDVLASNHDPERYPSGYVRFLTSSGILRMVFTQQCPDYAGFPELVRQKLIKCFAILSGDMDCLGHPMAANIHYENEQGEVVKVYDHIGEAFGFGALEPVHARWSRIRSFLEPLLRGGKLAPATASPY